MMKKMHETIMLAIMKAYFNYFDYETNDFFNAESKTLKLFKRCHQINSIFKWLCHFRLKPIN